MAAPCAFVLPGGAKCGAKKAAPVHLHVHPDHHKYADATKGGLKGESDGRREYRQSEAHKDAMELSAGAHDCWPAAYGAPGECWGEIGPSHILSSGAHGGLPVADTLPAPPACQAHNAGNEQSIEIREWAERTYFTFNGRQYPFKVTLAWLQAEREGLRI